MLYTVLHAVGWVLILYLFFFETLGTPNNKEWHTSSLLKRAWLLLKGHSWDFYALYALGVALIAIQPSA